MQDFKGLSAIGTRKQRNGYQTWFFIQDRFLYTKDNEKSFRGVNHMFIWTDRKGNHSEIAKTGANVVRIVWNMRRRIYDLDHIICECIANNMIPCPNSHDATGKWDRPILVNFWLRDENAPDDSGSSGISHHQHRKRSRREEEDGEVLSALTTPQ